MDNFDMELARLRDEVSRSEQLRRRLGSMRSQRETLAAREAELRAARIEEAEDVEGLEGRSLARFIYSLTGSLEERLDRERAEAREAAVRHDSVLCELEDLDADIDEAGAELRRLSGCEERYEQALRRKAEALRRAGGPVGRELEAIERERRELEITRRETAEAIAAGRYAAECAAGVADSLSSASTMGMVDMFTDSFFVDLAKHMQLDSAQGQMERLRVALRRFDTELGDIGRSLDVQLGSFLGFADFFFDGLFVDFMVNSRIANSLDAVRDVQRRISDALSRLESAQYRCGEAERQLERRYAELVTGA